MSPQLHASIGEAFLSARQLAGPERRAFLEQLADPTLRERVEALLQSDPGADDGFLAVPLLEPLAATLGETAATSVETACLVSGTISLSSGVFKVERVLGEGGSATVYLAEQLSPLRRTVALKILRHPAGRADAIARFNAECHAVARMQHPGIAALFDAGRTPQGFPFFVLEYIPGVPVTEYCRRTQPDQRKKLHLFLQIAAAVTHAHQKGVVHRDLKPSNILVAEGTDGPLAKVIDFGIAKSLGGPLQSLTCITAHGQLLGTLSYMSPEQLAGDPSQVDVRTDVYTLGALLEEMLTGRPAVDVEGVDLPTAIRRIEQGRPVQSRKRDSALPRDLDLIIGKAMALKPARRYQSVTELASEAERFLESRPVLARAPGPFYIADRFARRHKAVAMVAMVAAVALVAAGVLLISEKRRAERHYEVSRETATFLMQEVIGPISDRVGARAVRISLLKRALAQTAAFSDIEAENPVVQRARAGIIAALADLKEEEGDFERARVLNDEVLALRRRLAALAPEDLGARADLSIAIVRVGDMFKAGQGGGEGGDGEWHKAVPFYLEALEIDEALAAAEPDNRRFVSNLAWSYERIGARHRMFGQWEQAAESFQKALGVLDRLEELGGGPDDIARCRTSTYLHLSQIARDQGAAAEAAMHARTARALADAALLAAPASRQAALSSAWAWFVLALAEFGLAEYRSALRSLEGAHSDLLPVLHRDPKDAAARAQYLTIARIAAWISHLIGDRLAEALWQKRWIDAGGTLGQWPPGDPLILPEPAIVSDA
jgi:tetratricopeptide (TPR) repeat protein